MNTYIEILKSTRPPLRWFPEAKEHTQRFINRKEKESNGANREALDSVLIEAQRILGRCLPPTDPPNHETGLVIGYVQSGKTLSFTTVISLARDNNYGLIIVLAGTQNTLKDQSEDRLLKDLGLEEANNCWQLFPNPSINERHGISSRLSGWQKEKNSDRIKKAVLITVLKQTNRLISLTEVLKNISLENIPTLIIDDESDQASLNTRAKQNRGINVVKSPIYKNILDLRNTIPHHTFIQYTATPQANLLLVSADLLSPSFVELVTPGDGYVGGKDFFLENPMLVKEIDSKQVFSSNNHLTSPPPSLISAIRFFLLGAAFDSWKTKGCGKANRSMMVHPSQSTDPHHTYKSWVDNAYTSIKMQMESAVRDNNFEEVEKYFSSEYGELKNSYDELPELKILLEEMDNVSEELNIVEINATAQAVKKIKWKDNRYWILVGGQKLDRGFTVEGLSITYMPRPLGNSPKADTLQQRARFFGYKKTYLGLCRVFVQAEVRDAFIDYVEHEEFVRDALKEWQGKPLKDWARDFLLDKMLKPTRPNVISRNIEQISIEKWQHPNYMHVDKEAIIKNQELLKNVKVSWLKEYKSIDAGEHSQFHDKRGKSSERNILIECVPLRSVLEDFILQINIRNTKDAKSHTVLSLMMSELLRQNSNSMVDVFLMGETSQQRSRKNSSVDAPIDNPFSGRSVNYVGDEALHSSERLTLQLRAFNLRPSKSDKPDIHDVPWYAMYIPKNLSKGFIIEKRDKI